MIIHKIVSGVLHQQCYIIACPDSRVGVVIDPGGKAKQIAAIIRQEGLQIAYIINTHWHPDHTGANRRLKKMLGVPLVLQRADLPYLRQIMNGTKFFTGHWSLSPIPEMLIDGDMELTMGSLTLQLIHTPGHSPGGMCIHCAGHLFTGDTLFVGDSGATSFKGGNRPQLGASLCRLMTLLAPETTIYPGHNYGPTPTSTLAWEKQHNCNAREYGFYEAGAEV